MSSSSVGKRDASTRPTNSSSESGPPAKQARSVLSSSSSSSSKHRSKIVSKSNYDFDKFVDTPVAEDRNCILGQGTFAQVKLVSFRGQHYALRQLSKRVHSHPRLNTMLKREVEILKEMDHPCIAKLHATAMDAYCLYMLLELVPGGELFSLINGVDLSFKKMQYGLACIVDALIYIHAKGYVFRDIKPENVVVTREGRLKLIDFGFAKKLESTEETYTLCGTPDYMSPEMAQGQGHGFSTDYWALGVLLFEMNCGYAPFGKTAHSMRNPAQDESALNKEWNARDIVASIRKVEDYKTKQALIPNANSYSHLHSVKPLIHALLTEVPSGRPALDVIKSDTFFGGFDWESWMELDPPLKPPLGANDVVVPPAESYEPVLYTQSSDNFNFTWFL